jgi:hypothetical protein
VDVRSVITEPSALLTVRHVTVHGDQRQIGRSLAAAAEAAHGDDARPRPIDPDLERVRRRWFDLHHPALAARGRGVADHFGIATDDLSVALDALGTLSRRPACSVTFHPGARMSDGHPLLARNMDFPTTTFSEFQGRQPFPGERAAAADPWIVELHPDDGHASICIGFGDVMGGMDGINAAGLAVALLADSVQPPLEPLAGPQVGLSEAQVVRYLLDTCATAAEAKDALRLAKHYYQGLPCHYVVADRSGASFVWEHSRHRNRELVVEPPAGQGDRLVCTNHLLHRWPDATDLSDDDDEAGTAVRTYARWRMLTAASSTGGVVTRDEVGEQLAAVRFVAPAEGTRTIWHAMYDLAAAAAELRFFLGEDGATSTYSAPVVIALGPG